MCGKQFQEGSHLDKPSTLDYVDFDRIIIWFLETIVNFDFFNNGFWESKIII